MEQNSTIVAIATPAGIGALAVIRLTGPRSFYVVSRCISQKEKFQSLDARKIALLRITKADSDKSIDEATVIKYPFPNSFTGEEMVEIICHGGPFIVKTLVNELINAGATSAQKGEFTKRAFLNGKIDLMKAEAIKGMIESTNEINNTTALRALNGEYKQTLNRWKEELISVLADIEADIEFGEEHDVEKRVPIMSLCKLEQQIEEEIRRRNQIKEYDSGIKVVIAGPANAGKSTMFNKMVGYDRVLTNENPGTTRDWISEKIYIDSTEVTITDSAGIRETENSIELAGISNTKREIEKADIIIWLTAVNEELSVEEMEWIKKLDKKNTVFVLNKKDLAGHSKKQSELNKAGISFESISLKDPEYAIIEIERIKLIVKNKVDLIRKEIELPDVISNKRQEGVAKDVLYQIRKANAQWDYPEIAAHHLNIALEYMGEFLGKRDREDVLNRVFETFCIGK